MNPLGDGGGWSLDEVEQPTLDVHGGVCRSRGRDGGINLFKTLLTGECTYDCKYCQNSIQCGRKAGSYRPGELARVFMQLYSMGTADGLFLTSGICHSPDYTTCLMLDALKSVRADYGFRGYVHFKILPGASRELVKEACLYADRVSINIEAPDRNYLSQLTSMKDFKIDILRRQRWIRDFKPRCGHTTQMVVGAGSETDWQILKTAEWEYKRMGVSRVYYSAFTPLRGTPLERKEETPKSRERRLYCVDYMMRHYGIKLGEFKAITEEGNLPPGDPKIHLALKHFNRPVDPNDATYQELVRIPGIGPKSALNMLHLQEKNIKIHKRKQLSNLGIKVKHVEPYIKLNGQHQKKLKEYY